ncbi:putative bifunctional diguanylate cyclase/phosphodiesterase [Rhizorhapis sp. SPR117]|uniref:putative bifunctional diguanylate cyclase/phosphodiesterase n=1 Tax=Rhizorhapis sp. SPR117 TaxID=2912611 RepID=UPI001F1C4318|nr:EAL domain-containing protein [Rhizorhapis sp. SPR117]
MIRPLPEKALQGELQRRQYEVLKANIPTMYTIILIQLAAWMIGRDPDLPPLTTLYLPAVLTAIIVVRMTIWLNRRDGNPDPATIKIRIRSTVISAWALSILMGGYGLSILFSVDPDHQGLVLLFLSLGAVAGGYCLAALPSAALPTLLVGVMPVAVPLLVSGEKLRIAISIDIVLTCLIVLRMIVVQYREFVANIVAQAREKQLAQSDALTGLPNRRAFMEHLQEKIAQADNSERFVLLMIDLNGFKPINDNYGHRLGDQLLVQIAQRLGRSGGPQCFAARLGGDEFAVVGAGIASPPDAIELARSIMEIFSQPFCVEGVTVTLSACIGFALFPDDARDDISLISNADLALYRGKKSGGTHIVHYDSNIKMQTKRAMQLEQAMGLKDGISEVDVVYQPIVDLANGTVLRFEALARWTDPDLGDVNPMEFISAAERTGKISRMSERIFDKALLAAASWPLDIGLSMNLSPVQLHNPSTPLLLARLFDFYRFDPARMEIEIAEAAFLNDFDTTRLTVQLLREIGVRIVLDNFGTGFASVGYLKEIAFDHVKIDGQLIRDVDVSPPSQLLVAGIVQLCGAMGVKCTAEQIERESQRSMLRQLECERGQGYLFGRPMSADKVLNGFSAPGSGRQFSALLAFPKTKRAV